MKYDEVLKRIGTLTQRVQRDAQRGSWALQRTTPSSIRANAQARVDGMKASNEPFRRMPSTEHERVQRDIERELTVHRGLAASVPLWLLQPAVTELDGLYRDFVTARKRDTSLSFEDALDHVDANGMLVFALLEESVRPTIEAAGPDDLLRRYERALESRDARGLIEATLIETRIAQGAGLAASTQQLPVVKRLHEIIEGVQDLRVPYESMRDVPDTLTFGRHVITMADTAGVRPINAEHPANITAKQAYESEHGEYRAFVEATAAAMSAAE